MQTLKTSVVICGAGPVGLTLAHLLGVDGVDVILLERLESTVTEPRAIAIDGESLRTLQRVDLLAGFEDELLTGITADYVNGHGECLFHAGNPERRPWGFATINSFDQPTLDRYLADELGKRESVQLRFGHALEHFEQDGEGVRVHCTDAAGDPLTIEAQYLVGCDGGRSTVRSKLGIRMRGESNPQPWLVIDTVDPHLDNTLDCRFYCDPERPGMTIRKRHGERRWEWMLMPGEEREFLLADENIRELLAPYTDAAQVDIYRKRVYDFHAIMADRWREGRVFLAGDAAHMTPPFAGQGLNSGLRDVSNLSWKLSTVVRGLADEAILDSYEQERKDHAWQLIETALQLGRQIQPIDTDLAAERDAFFAELRKDPAAVQALEDEMFGAILDRSIDSGLVTEGEGHPVCGRMMIQPTLDMGGTAVALDDELGQGFAIIGYNCDPALVLQKPVLTGWSKLGARLLTIRTETSPSCPAQLTDDKRVLADWLGTDSPCLFLVRPDRFCSVCCEPGRASGQLQQALDCLTSEAGGGGSELLARDAGS